MAVHYGHEVVTTENLLILDLIAKNNVILIVGSIQGPKNGIVMIKS